MKKQSLLFFISSLCIILNIIILIGYQLLVKAPVVNGEGFILLVPPVLGVLGLILSIIDFVKRKEKQTIILIISNILFVFTWPIMFYGYGLFDMIT